MSCEGMDPRYPMKADIYVSTDTQDPVTGRIYKDWSMVKSGVLCALASDKFNSDTRYAIQTKSDLFDMPLLLFGRFQEDIRRYNGGMLVMTDLLVTNVRGFCDDEPLFVESIDGKPSATLFEVATLQPFVNPWGQAEYYKTQLMRMDDQVDVL